MIFTIYDDSGVILRTGNCPESMIEIQSGSGENLIETEADGNLQYVDVATKTVVDKPQLVPVLNKTTLLANGVDSIVMTGLPNPTAVQIDDDRPYTVIDDVFEFTVSLPGDYVVRVNAVNRLSYETTVTAT